MKRVVPLVIVLLDILCVIGFVVGLPFILGFRWLTLIVYGVVGFLCFVWPLFRGFALHPISSIYYAVKDLLEFVYVRRWRECEQGFIDMYCGLFGQGKTLSATRRLIKDYKKYNGKIMRVDGKLQRCEVHVFSNVELKTIPYTPLTHMQQLVDWQSYAALPENHNKYALFCIDEASSVLNSRDFRENMNYFTINSLLTCRHSRMGLILTSQRFGQVDKLCRDVCQKVVQCQKIWRILVHRIYDAYELENVANPLNVKPLAMRVVFCGDRSYQNYDTLQLVEQIKKDTVDGKMRTDAEILAALAPTQQELALPEKRLKKEFRVQREKRK